MVAKTKAKTLRLLTFEQVLEKREKDGKTHHVLLGNGFSRAFRDDIFSYDALFEQADFDSIDPRIQKAFGALKTRDFEVVMRALREMANLSAIYLPKRTVLRQTLLEHANSLRDVLAKTIASNHPKHPGEISEQQCRACRSFLGHFKDVYTLNYDLLPYWVLMRTELGASLKNDDGFRTPETGQEDYVTWEVENSNTQTVFYLHGALHLFDAGAELQKYTWKNTGIRLIKQIRAALESDKYPLIVAEGKAVEKRRRIKHSGYLTRGFRSFSQIGGSLATYGVSFSKQDEHIIHAIEKGSQRNSVCGLYVGIFGDPKRKPNQQLIHRVKQMVAKRPSYRPPLSVNFYDASSARVWG